MRLIRSGRQVGKRGTDEKAENEARAQNGAILSLSELEWGCLQKV